MSDILLDDTTKDISIVQGNLFMTGETLVAIKQRLSQRLGLFLAEWFLDQSRGIPYIEQVFKKNPNPTVIDAIFKGEIIKEPTVKEFRSFSLDLDPVTRELTVAFNVLTVVGPLDFSEAFGI